MRIGNIGVTLMAMAGLILSCVSCATYRGPWDSTDDQHAQDVQRHLDSTVKVIEDTMLFNTFDKSVGTVNSSGSGVVVLVKDHQSLVISAAHVCTPPPQSLLGGLGLVGGITIYKVEDTNGNTHIAQVVLKDESSDLCAMKIFGVAGRPVDVYGSNVPVGGEVLVVGAANGTYGKKVGYFDFGGYMGDKDVILGERPFSLFSVQTVGGNSGGPVFYRGGVVSIVSRSDRHGTTLGATHDDLRSFVEKAKREWLR